MGTMHRKAAEAMGSYRQKPREILAVRLTDSNAKEMAQLVNGNLHPGTPGSKLSIYFHCCNTRVKAEWGDWIVRDSRGYSVMTHEQFEAQYEEQAA